MSLFDAILAVIVVLAIATAILLFERRRAREIEHDLREQQRGAHRR